MKVSQVFSYSYKSSFLRESLRVVPDTGWGVHSYRADLTVRNGQEEWHLCNNSGRPIKTDGVLGKQILKAVREYKEGLE